MTKTTDGITTRCEAIVKRGSWAGNQCTAGSSYAVITKTNGELKERQVCKMHLAEMIRYVTVPGRKVIVRRDL